MICHANVRWDCVPTRVRLQAVQVAVHLEPGYHEAVLLCCPFHPRECLVALTVGKHHGNPSRHAGAKSGNQRPQKLLEN